MAKAKQEVFEVSEDDYHEGCYGICLSCGNVQEGCEPDAREYECQDCGEPEVYGLEEALMMGRVTVGGDE